MTIEQIVIKIQAGETDLMLALWEQVERFVKMQVGKFYHRHTDRCTSLCVGFENLQQEAYLSLYKAVDGYNVNKG